MLQNDWTGLVKLWRSSSSSIPIAKHALHSPKLFSGHLSPRQVPLRRQRFLLQRRRHRWRPSRLLHHQNLQQSLAEGLRCQTESRVELKSAQRNRMRLGENQCTILSHQPSTYGLDMQLGGSHYCSWHGEHQNGWEFGGITREERFASTATASMSAGGLS